MSYVLYVSSALLLLASLILATMGADWIQYGYGLNPWLAFPSALFTLVTAYRVGMLAIEWFGLVDE